MAKYRGIKKKVAKKKAKKKVAKKRPSDKDTGYPWGKAGRSKATKALQPRGYTWRGHKPKKKK